MLTSRSLALALAALLLACAPASAQSLDGELKSAASVIADHLQKLAKEQKVNAARVGEFIGNDQFTKGTGAKVQAALIEALKAAKVRIDEGSAFKVSGSYEVEVGDKGQLPDRITILLAINVQFGNKKLTTIDKKVSAKFGNDDVLELIPRPIDLGDQGNATPEKRNEALPPQLKDPPVSFDGTKVKLSKDSLFAVEVVAGPAGKKPGDVRKPFVKAKLPHVKLAQGEEYILRVHNLSKDELALGVTIDGVDRYQFFQPARDRPRLVLVAKGKSIDIEGWRTSKDEVAAFLVGPLLGGAKLKGQVGDEYKTLASSSDIGLITVTAHPSWKEGEAPDARSRDVGTDLGRKIHSPAKIEPRIIGASLGKVVIRYEKK